MYRFDDDSPNKVFLKLAFPVSVNPTDGSSVGFVSNFKYIANLAQSPVRTNEK